MWRAVIICAFQCRWWLVDVLNRIPVGSNVGYVHCLKMWAKLRGFRLWLPSAMILIEPHNSGIYEVVAVAYSI